MHYKFYLLLNSLSVTGQVMATCFSLMVECRKLCENQDACAIESHVQMCVFPALNDSGKGKKARWKTPFKIHSCRGASEAFVFQDRVVWGRTVNLRFQKIALED